MKKIFFIIVITSISYLTFSQDTYQLAVEYYRNEEYEKASVLFENLYKQKKVKFYFNYYLNCLIEMGEYSEAEKKVKKEIRKHKSDISFHVDLGYVYKRQGDEENATKEYNYVIDNLTPDKQAIIQVANTFVAKKEYEWSEKTYFAGRKLIKYTFHLELANLYAITRRQPEMIDEYLEYLAETSANYKYVKTRFQYYLDHDLNDEFYNLLRKKILYKIQVYQYDIFNELLIWVFIQHRDFNSAYMQARSLDKRNNENGVRVFKIAELAFENKEYQVANNAYEYVISKGRYQPYYYKARFGLLSVLNVQVVNNEVTTENEIKNIEEQYLTTINELGVSETTIQLIIDLTHLQAFYLNKTEAAITLLNEAIAINNLKPDLKGRCEIELGNIFLVSNQPWDAIITYAKAENLNKQNEIGDFAKFYKAKVYYYMGNFDWALTQIDVLKGSTSKLISNDAFELSNLISNNTEEDTTYDVMQFYARAGLLFFQNKLEKSNQTLDSILALYKNHALSDDIYFMKYKIAMIDKNYTLAAENLKVIIDNYSWDILGDKSLFLLAQLNDNQLNNKEEAMELYKKLMLDYKGSIYVSRARERFRILRGDFEVEN